ncbi:hypothetical protein MMC07_003785 [Pseudocyphellaria aurata]|nr:hypothetical protein [Pseudocyphellaria aurata]
MDGLTHLLRCRAYIANLSDSQQIPEYVQLMVKHVGDTVHEKYSQVPQRAIATVGNDDEEGYDDDLDSVSDCDTEVDSQQGSLEPEESSSDSPSPVHSDDNDDSPSPVHSEDNDDSQSPVHSDDNDESPSPVHSDDNDDSPSPVHSDDNDDSDDSD